MGTAYTPGLTVSENYIVRRTRKLPIKGDVFVNVGDTVNPTDIIANAELPGNLNQIKISHLLGLNPKEVPQKMLKKIGDQVKKDEVIARNTYLFNLIKSVVKSPVDGVLEYVSDVSGNVGVREPSVPVQLTAYIKGKIVEVIPDEGAVVETEASFIQGIFGVDGERQGVLQLAKDPEETIDEQNISPDMKGKILVGRSMITGRALKKAVKVGLRGVVVGGIIDKQLIELLGYEIGVAITGQENVGVTLVLTEGFGDIKMADKTFELLQSLEGKEASINGSTQIRAGVIRPEVIVPTDESEQAITVADQYNANRLEIGTNIRVIREPYFGLLGTVTELPPELIEIETGAKVRILKAKLEMGEEVSIPRANVEIV